MGNKIKIGLGLSCTLAALGCGGANQSGVALGKVGQHLGAQAESSPQGGGLCLVQEALAAQAGGPEKPMSDACAKALKRDRMWRRAMLAVSAYGDTLTEVASGDADDNTGRAQAATTGINGNEWIEVDSADSAAREATASLVAHFRDTAKKDDLGALIQGAAPHVKTICNGLLPYLESQASGFADAQRETEKKRMAKIERRCGAIDNKTVCVNDSATDRVVYATTLSQLSLLESNASEARAAAAGFCAAHGKLEEAAGSGKLKSDDTLNAVVDAIQGARTVEATPAPEKKKK